MVEQVTAFKDSSGALHPSELSAARADAEILLGKILGEKHKPIVKHLCDNAQAVEEAITGYAALLRIEGLPDPSGDTPTGSNTQMGGILGNEYAQPAGQPFQCNHPSTTDIGHGRKRCVVCEQVLGAVTVKA